MAHEANYTWIEWCNLDESERASEIAHHRITNAIEAQVHEAYTRYEERRVRRQRK